MKIEKKNILIVVLTVFSDGTFECVDKQFNHSDNVIFLSLFTSQYLGIFLPHFRNVL